MYSRQGSRHGFLTQGWARSSSRPVMGIGTDATADYRTAALQLRYALGSNDAVVIQVSHTRIGNSVLNDINPDVELDWAFWQHRLGPVSARVGKVPMPRGIYNEIRDVGTLLPFYRAPVSIYSEGFETIDDAVLSHSLNWHGWGLDTDVYAGTWKGIELDFDGEDASEVEVELMKRTLAGQVWLRTPVPGLRVGLSAARWDEEDLSDDDPIAREGFVLGSVDGAFVPMSAPSTAWRSVPTASVATCTRNSVTRSRRRSPSMCRVNTPLACRIRRRMRTATRSRRSSRSASPTIRTSR